jgi:class 3 adenylate cyclase/predicted Ser/Thr protein kinase
MAANRGRTILGRFEDPSKQVEQILARPQPAPSDSPAYAQAVRAVLFTDIVGSTAYFETRGDQAGMAMLERHNRLLFPEVERVGGRVVKTIGDAIMAAFETAEAAVRAAVAMQTALQRHNLEVQGDDRIFVRIGVHHGPVILHGDDLFGDVVNAAARVEALARGKQILISRAVEDQLGPDFPVERAVYDAFRVRGKEAPLEALEVRWDPEGEVGLARQAILAAGHRIGQRFEIVSVLGQGGMGVVYRVRDLDLEVDLALKFLHPGLLLDEEVIDRFKREVRLARSVTHPSICRIHEFLKMEGQLFLSMELLEGRTLEQWIESGDGFAPDQFEAIVTGICEALQAAHEKGITHRDLKPANVMVEHGTGRVVLMDFGIAHGAKSRRATEIGVVLGTPEYMSPEQVEGQFAGPSSDIYSLGVMMYEMLSGAQPFVDESPMMVAVKHLSEAAPALGQVAPQAPERLVRIVERCMAKRPADRFGTVGELLAALRNEGAVDFLQVEEGGSLGPYEANPAAEFTLVRPEAPAESGAGRRRPARARPPVADEPLVWDEAAPTDPGDLGAVGESTDIRATQVAGTEPEPEPEPEAELRYDDLATEVLSARELAVVHSAGSPAGQAPAGPEADVATQVALEAAAEAPAPGEGPAQGDPDNPWDRYWWVWVALVAAGLVAAALVWFVP